MKKTVDAFDYSAQIMKALKKGLLLTTSSGNKVNTMTIGWGALCVEWYLPIFVAYVRESRYTKQLLEESGEFTVNIPLDTCDKNILSYCGTKSGRDTDKIEDLGLHLEESEIVHVPGIRELPLTLECKVIYKQPQALSAIKDDLLDRYYPIGESGKRDGHSIYYGQIVNAYIIEG